MLRNFIKEVSFYRTLAGRVTISVPRCYYAAIDGEGPEFALLLEDLAPARQGDQLAGCSTEVAHAAVLELVGLHAPSWCDESLRGVDWLGEPNEATAELIRGLYRAQLPGFLARYGARLEHDEVADHRARRRVDGAALRAARRSLRRWCTSTIGSTTC